MIACTRQRGERLKLSHLLGRQKGANLSGRNIIADISKLMLSALNTAELSGQLARLGLARQIFVGEIYMVLILGKLLLRKIPSKKQHPCYKAAMLVTSFKDCSKLLDFLFSSFFSALFFPSVYQGCLHFITVSGL